MDGCNQSGSITRQLIKISNAYGSSSKKVAVLSTKMLSKIIRYKASINGGLRDTFATNTVSLEKMDDCNCSLKKKTSHLQVWMSHADLTKEASTFKKMDGLQQFFS